MREHNSEIDRTHNIVLVIITIACIAAIIETASQRWEFWVPPLIFIGVIASWYFHISHYGRIRFREDFYVILCMVVSFYHGIHKTSFFDIVIISMLLMVTITLLGRGEFLVCALIEFFVLIIVQMGLVYRSGEHIFDSLSVSRLALHILSEVCVFKGLGELIKTKNKNEALIKSLDEDRKHDREDIEKFLGNIYQDLMIPVNSICKISSAMIKRKPEEDLINIIASGMRLAWQIRDIYDYSEIQSDSLVLEEENYRITDLFDEYMTDYRTGPVDINTETIIDLDPEVPAILNGDVYKLGKIIRLIIHNAGKYTNEGCIYTRISGIKKNNDFNLSLEFSDTGVGMSKEYLEKISEGSYVADRVRDKKLGGIGLGLPIVYGFVRKMNGFVSIDSHLHQGTTIKIVIPQKIVDESPCLSIDGGQFINIAMYSNPGKFNVPLAREYMRAFSVNIAQGLRVNLYSASTFNEFKKILNERDVTHIFLGNEEYSERSDYFDELSKTNISVIVSAHKTFRLPEGSMAKIMLKPLYSHSVVEFLSEPSGRGEVCPEVEKGGRV